MTEITAMQNLHADLTHEQREALSAILHRLVMTASRAMAAGEDVDGTAIVVIGAESRALSEILALGWRAPGPPTEEEVEMAAAAICDARLWPGAWIKANEVESDNLRHEARAALTAALGGKPDA